MSNNVNKKKNKVKSGSLVIPSLESVYNNSIDLSTYSAVSLKLILKIYRLRYSGTKRNLIQRLILHATRIMSSVKMQRVFRGFLLRKSFMLRGIALKNRGICVNESDFYTLEPLNEIPPELFYSYTDSNFFTYGFNITSIATLLIKNSKLINPYNRNKIMCSNLNDIILVYNYTNIFFKNMLNDYEHKQGVERFIYYHNLKQLKKKMKGVIKKKHIRPQITIEEAIQEDLNTNADVVEETPENIVIVRESVEPSVVVSTINGNNVDDEEEETVLSDEDILNNATRIIERTRSNSFRARVTELFIEIDLLGNYTSMSWFMNLNQMQSINFYITMRENWHYRSIIPDNIKRKISPLGDPFIENEDLFELMENGEFRRTEEIKMWCLSVMEKLILTGENVEYCRLGTFQVLMALTAVSIQARNSMYWLYESLF